MHHQYQRHTKRQNLHNQNERDPNRPLETDCQYVADPINLREEETLAVLVQRQQVHSVALHSQPAQAHRDTRHVEEDQGPSVCLSHEVFTHIENGEGQEYRVEDKAAACRDPEHIVIGPFWLCGLIPIFNSFHNVIYPFKCS